MAKVEGQPKQSYFEELFSTGRYESVFSDKELSALVAHEEFEVEAWKARQTGSLPDMLGVTFGQIDNDKSPAYKSAIEKKVKADNDQEIRLVSDLNNPDDRETSDIRLISDLE